MDGAPPWVFAAGRTRADLVAFGGMTNRKKSTRRLIALLIAALLCAGAGRALYQNRWRVWPKRFAVVEPGWLYRGGQVDTGLIEGLIDKYRIEGILSLT